MKISSCGPNHPKKELRYTHCSRNEIQTKEKKNPKWHAPNITCIHVNATIHGNKSNVKHFSKQSAIYAYVTSACYCYCFLVQFHNFGFSVLISFFFRLVARTVWKNKEPIRQNYLFRHWNYGNDNVLMANAIFSNGWKHEQYTFRTSFVSFKNQTIVVGCSLFSILFEPLVQNWMATYCIRS